MTGGAGGCDRSGLTTLPSDESFWADRIDDSLRAFRPRVRQPGGEYYLFALEETATGELLGVSGIASRGGGFEPWYSYEIREELPAHLPLEIHRQVSVLHLQQEHWEMKVQPIIRAALRGTEPAGGIFSSMAIPRWPRRPAKRPRRASRPASRAASPFG